MTFYGLVFSLLAFGFEVVILYSYGTSSALGDRIVRTALALRLIAAAIAVPVFLGFVWGFAPEESHIGLIVLIPVLFGRGIAEIARNVYVARQNVWRNFPNVMIFRTTEVAIGTALVINGASVVVILAVHALSWCGEALLGLWLMKKDYALAIARPERAAWKELLHRGAPMAAISVTNIFLFSAPVLIFGWAVSDFSALGQLGIALQIMAIILAGVDAFLTTAIPVVAHAESRDDQRLNYYGALIAGLVTLCFAVIAILTHLFVGPVLTTLLGSGYEQTIALTLPAIGIAWLYLVPIGFLQLMIVEKRYVLSLAPNLIACVVISVGMLIAANQMTPQIAILIAWLAWATRAVTIIALALPTNRRLITAALKPD